MLTLSQRLPANADILPDYTLSLTAEERTRCRRRLRTEEGEEVYLQLPRGTVLHDRDLLASETGEVLVLAIAKPEPVFCVTSPIPLKLLQGAYHLGNRHVQLEITPTSLYLSPDPVLKQMLEQLGVEVKEMLRPFQPELGAYGHHHSTSL